MYECVCVLCTKGVKEKKTTKMLKGQKIRQIFLLKLKTALKRIEIFVYKDIHDGSSNNGKEEEAAKDKEIH